MQPSIAPHNIRIAIFSLFIIAAFAFLAFNMWEVQIEKGEEHRKLISKQSIRRIRIPSVRGRVFTADQIPVADNEPTYSIVFHLGEMRQPGPGSRTITHILNSIAAIGKTVGRPSAIDRDDLIRHIVQKPGLPMTIIPNLSRQELARAITLDDPIKGMDIEILPRRVYHNPAAYSNLIGYTGPEDPKSADDKEQFFYYVPDHVGRRGIEARFDELPNLHVPLRGLRGNPGGSIVRVDNRGYIFENISSEDAVNGNDVILTIDSRAQTIAASLLKGLSGAIVLLDADNGNILAMASSPGYDPNTISNRISKDEWRALVADKSLPMLNRATEGAYIPGSIVKPLVALALLHNHADTSAVDCDGATHIGSTRIRCHSWRNGGHGIVDLDEAITVSCNDYFIEKGMKLGMEKIGETFRAFGLGSPSGFELPERQGLVPTREDKLRIYKTRWNEYDTALMSIGQGMMLLTPLQAEVFTAAIANGGRIVTPAILKEVRSPDGHTLHSAIPPSPKPVDISSQHLDIVKNAMMNVVNAPRGSGKKAANPKIQLYGKSGTGEVGSAANRHSNPGFSCCGFHRGRAYAMTVFVERGLSGGNTCAPIAGEFFNRWLTGDDDPTPRQ